MAASYSLILQHHSNFDNHYVIGNHHYIEFWLNRLGRHFVLIYLLFDVTLVNKNLFGTVRTKCDWKTIPKRSFNILSHSITLTSFITSALVELLYNTRRTMIFTWQNNERITKRKPGTKVGLLATVELSDDLFFFTQHRVKTVLSPYNKIMCVHA